MKVIRNSRGNYELNDFVESHGIENGRVKFTVNLVATFEIGEGDEVDAISDLEGNIGFYKNLKTILSSIPPTKTHIRIGEEEMDITLDFEVPEEYLKARQVASLGISLTKDLLFSLCRELQKLDSIPRAIRKLERVKAKRRKIEIEAILIKAGVLDIDGCLVTKDKDLVRIFE